MILFCLSIMHKASGPTSDLLFLEPDGAGATAPDDVDGVRNAVSFLLALAGAAGDAGAGLQV